MEPIWALCSMSVYPLYYEYIRRLTSSKIHSRNLWLSLLPGALVAMAILLFPGRESDTARQVLMGIQILVVVYYGYKRLRNFDRQLAEVYADMEGRITRPIQNLLVAFIITSMLSVTVNAIGKQYFSHEDMALFPIAAMFSIMLFLLSYIGYVRTFSADDYAKDYANGNSENDAVINLNKLGQSIEVIMHEQRLYLKQNLKIADLANATGSCRTYVSMYLNQMCGITFSDYINNLRIEHTKELLLKSPTKKNRLIAEESGFMSEQSFYRNFKKYTGMNPQEWIKANRLISNSR